MLCASGITRALGPRDMTTLIFSPISRYRQTFGRHCLASQRQSPLKLSTQGHFSLKVPNTKNIGGLWTVSGPVWFPGFAHVHGDSLHCRTVALCQVSQLSVCPGSSADGRALNCPPLPIPPSLSLPLHIWPSSSGTRHTD